MGDAGDPHRRLAIEAWTSISNGAIRHHLRLRLDGQQVAAGEAPTLVDAIWKIRTAADEMHNDINRILDSMRE